MKNNKKRRGCRIGFAFLWTILFIPYLSTLPLMGQSVQADAPVPGLINIKFSANAVGEINQTLRSEQISNPEVRSILALSGFDRGEKIFRHFEERDTLATSRRTGEQVRLIDLSRWYMLQVADTVNIEQLAQRLMELPGIEAASPEFLMKPQRTCPSQYICPDDPRFQFGQQWGLFNFNNPGNDIHAPQAWQLNTGRSDVIVAIVDGGIDYNHIDLDPGNRSRVIQGYDVADGNSDPMDDIPSQYGFANHGTAVAGIIGAITDNSQQVAGVMWDVKIMPVKVAHTSSPWWNPFGWVFEAGTNALNSDIAAGVDYARQNGADIINLSLGGEGVSGEWYSTFYNNPVTQATYNAYLSDVLVVTSMGNDGEEKLNYPAAFPWTVAIGASNQFDFTTSFSNSGSHIDVVAPGISYFTTHRGNNDGTFGGTSAAAPVVSGVAGLVLSHSKDLGLNLTNDDIRNVIRVTAEKVPGMQNQDFTNEYGYGRVNAYEALKLISAPNVVEHGTQTGGSSEVVWDSHTHTFFRGMGTLASGTYFGVKTYKVSGFASFNNFYEDPPELWVRDRTTKGWSAANPNMQTPYVNITQVTNSGFYYETYVYWIGSNSAGQGINAYYPVNPSQAKIDYTAVGTPGTPSPPPPSVSLSGPSQLLANSFPAASYQATVTDGESPYTYQWWKQQVYESGPEGSWTLLSGASGSTYFFFPGDPETFNLRVDVTDDLNRMESDQMQVEIVGPSGSSTLSASTDTPESFDLTQNYPNPFNPSSTIRYALPERADVSLTVYNMLGQRVATLVEGEIQPGRHDAIFDASALSSGNYIARFTAIGISGDTYEQSFNMQLVK